MGKLGEIVYYVGGLIGSLAILFLIYQALFGAGMSPMQYTLSLVLYGICPILAGYVIRGLLSHHWGVFSSQAK